MGPSACELGVEGDVCEQVRPRVKLWDRSGSPGPAPGSLWESALSWAFTWHMWYTRDWAASNHPHSLQCITRQWEYSTDSAHNRHVWHHSTAPGCAGRQQKPPGSASGPLLEGPTLPLWLIDSRLPFLSLLGSPASTHVDGSWQARELVLGPVVSSSLRVAGLSPALGLGFQQGRDWEHRWGGTTLVFLGQRAWWQYKVEATCYRISIGRAGFICHPLPFTK